VICHDVVHALDGDQVHPMPYCQHLQGVTTLYFMAAGKAAQPSYLQAGVQGARLVSASMISRSRLHGRRIKTDWAERQKASVWGGDGVEKLAIDAFAKREMSAERCRVL
jgi:hypothetical protein